MPFWHKCENGLRLYETHRPAHGSLGLPIVEDDERFSSPLLVTRRRKWKEKTPPLLSALCWEQIRNCGFVQAFGVHTREQHHVDKVSTGGRLCGTIPACKGDG